MEKPNRRQEPICQVSRLDPSPPVSQSPFPGVFFVSSDHALWFHRPVDMNQWHFVEQRPLAAHGGRGTAAANVWSTDAKLVASFTQAALMRIHDGIGAE